MPAARVVPFAVAVASCACAAAPAGAAVWGPASPVPAPRLAGVPTDLRVAAGDRDVRVAWFQAGRLVGNPADGRAARVLGDAGAAGGLDLVVAGDTVHLVAGGPGGLTLRRLSADGSDDASGPSTSRGRAVRLVRLSGTEVAVVHLAPGGGLAADHAGPSGPPRSLGRVVTGAALGAAASRPGATALVAGADGGVVRTALISPTGVAGPEVAALAAGPGERVTGIAAAVAPSGAPAVAVALRDPAGGARIAVARGTTGNAWAAPAVRPTAGAVPAPPVLAAGPGDRLVVAWRSLSSRGARLVTAVEDARAGGPGAAAVLAGPSRTLGAPALATAPDGSAVLAYALGGRVVVRRLGPGARRWGGPVPVSGPLADCRDPRVAFSPRGRGVVAFACGPRVYVVTAR